MKKALTLIVLIITPSIIFGQGWVSFGNTSAGLVQQWTSAYDSTPAPIPVGGGYVELISTMQGNPLLHPLGVYEGSSGFLPAYSSLTGFLAANPGWAIPYAGPFGATPLAPVPINAAPARFNGGTATIANIGAGADADYLVIGWTGPYASYDAAYAADLANPNSSFLGISAIATTHTCNPLYINPCTPVPLGPTFQGMTLAPAVIPEPTTVLLAGLGAVLLVLLRRRG
jgi:PEP-CTERM motif